MFVIFLFLLVPIHADVSFINGNIFFDNNNGGSNTEELHTVLTRSGPVRGYVLENTDIVQYLDIPYGIYDVKNPFQEAKEPASWTNPLTNMKHESKCPQIIQATYIGINDCLTLSVFTRNGFYNADVLFHIHDGDFTTGSGDPEVYSPINIVPQGIILVLPNYRLGPLGFMCWRNDTVPGNAGLKDLALALDWVKTNIANFGGNASKIVVSGAASTGALVDLLVVSNKTSQFISKAITESGFALSHWVLDRDPLRTLDMKINFDGDLQLIIEAGKSMNFKPCIEASGGMIVDSYWNLIQNSEIDIPLMIGSANQAAMERVLHLNDQMLLEFNANLSLLLPTDLQIEINQEQEILNRIRMLYFGVNDIGKITLDRLSLCFTDSEYLSPGIRQARLLTQAGGTVYFYEFSYTLNNNRLITGASKGNSLRYIFDAKFSKDPKDKMNEYEKIVNTINPIKDLWLSFIKTGTPNTLNIKWNPFGTNGKEECLKIGPEIYLKDNLHIERLTLWDDIYDRYYIETNVSAKMKSSLYFIVLLNLVLNTF